MKAVILCGGKGSRLRPLTEVRPKPLITLMNVPVLETIIRTLENAGIDEIFLSLGFMSQEIINMCESLDTSANIRYCEESKPLGTAGGVKNCICSSDEPVLVVSGDNIFTADIKQAVNFHISHSSDFTVIGKKVEDPREYGCIIKEGFRIKSFTEKPNWENADSYLINTGLYIVDSKILPMIPENTFFDFATDLFPLLLNGNMNFLCWETEGFWGDIGEFDSYILLSKTVLNNYTGSFPVKGTLYLQDVQDINGNRIIAPCVIGKNTVIGSNSRIGPDAVLGDGVTIGNGCNIENSNIGRDCTVGDGTDITGAVIDDKTSIGASCVLESGAVVGYGCNIGKFSRLMSGVKIWPGKTVGSEAVINKDILYETPYELELDFLGISGKVYSQLTLSEAVKIGQALASQKDIKRIGVACDDKSSSAVYKDVLALGIRACGVACYDFEEVFQSQCYFYSLYCELDACVFVSTLDEVVNISFFGKKGMPVTADSMRTVNNNYRFSSFSYVPQDKTGILYRMSPLSVAYKCSLQKMLPAEDMKVTAVADCDNPVLKKFLNEFFDCLTDGKKTTVQFLFSYSGRDFYCIENEKFYSSDRLRRVLCEFESADGNDVAIPENASEKTEELMKKYGRAVYRLYDGCHDTMLPDTEIFARSLWNFDGVHLCVKIINLMSVTGLTLAELCNIQDDFSIRSKIIELNCLPSDVKNEIMFRTNGKRRKSDVYYSIPSDSGFIKIRQLGNTNRIRMIVEAGNTEAAKEIMSDISGKFILKD